MLGNEGYWAQFSYFLLMFYITTNNSINYKNTYKNTSTIMLAAILENSITEITLVSSGCLRETLPDPWDKTGHCNAKQFGFCCICCARIPGPILIWQVLGNGHRKAPELLGGVPF